MKVIQKIVNPHLFTVKTDESDKSYEYVLLSINENQVLTYRNDNKLDINIIKDLLENHGYATTLLYLNENYVLCLDNDNITNDNIHDFYEDCNELLNSNIVIVEEAGIPLTNIKGYPIFEGQGYILRGSGKKKIKESFITSECETLNDEAEDEEADEIPVNEDGTQVSDIAPKVDQDMNKRATNSKKKSYDILLDINENEGLINKGFLKNSNGQYQRGDYILVKEGNVYSAINKKKLNENTYDSLERLTQAPIYCFRTGDINTDRGLISFTTNKNIAKSYSSYHDSSNYDIYLVKINNPIIVSGSKSNTYFAHPVEVLSKLKNISKEEAKNELYSLLSDESKKGIKFSFGQVTYDDFKKLDRYIADEMYDTNYDSIVYGNISTNSDIEIQVLDKYANNIRKVNKDDSNTEINEVVCILNLDKPKTSKFYSNLDKALENKNITYNKINDTTIEFYGELNNLIDFIGYKFVSPDGGMPKKIQDQIINTLSSGYEFEPQKYKPSMIYSIGWKVKN